MDSIILPGKTTHLSNDASDLLQKRTQVKRDCKRCSCAPHSSGLTFPCMSSLMVKVTFSPPSTRLESIAAADFHTRNWPTKWVFGHWLKVCNRVENVTISFPKSCLLKAAVTRRPTSRSLSRQREEDVSGQ